MHFLTGLIAFGILGQAKARKTWEGDDAMPASAARREQALGFKGVVWPELNNRPVVKDAVHDVGFLEAHDHTIWLNQEGDNPSTYCPPELEETHSCPSPTPENVRTQFNTTLYQGDMVSGPGMIYMNSANSPGHGKQILYVQHDGMLRYTKPGQPVPRGGYAHAFILDTDTWFAQPQHFGTATALRFNGTYHWFTCPRSIHDTVNRVYAYVHGGKNVGPYSPCKPFIIHSVTNQLGGFPYCPYDTAYVDPKLAPKQHCDRAAYEYQ